MPAFLLEDFDWERKLDRCRRETMPLGPTTNKRRCTVDSAPDVFLAWPWQPARLFPDNCDLSELREPFLSPSPSPTVSEDSRATREGGFSLESVEEAEPRHYANEDVPLSHWSESLSSDVPPFIIELPSRKEPKPKRLETKMDRLRALRLQLEDFKSERRYPGGVRYHADLGSRIQNLEEIEKVLTIQARKEYYLKRARRRLRTRKWRKLLREEQRLFEKGMDVVNDGIVVHETVDLTGADFSVPDENLEVVYEFEEPFPDELTTSQDGDIPTNGVDPIFLAALNGGATSGDELVHTSGTGDSVSHGASVRGISNAMEPVKRHNSVRDLAEGIDDNPNQHNNYEIVRLSSSTE